MKQSDIFYQTIAMNPEVVGFLRERNYPKPKSQNEVIAMLIDYAGKAGNEGLFKLAEYHPNKDIFEAKYEAENKQNALEPQPQIINLPLEKPVEKTVTTPELKSEGFRFPISDKTVNFVVVASMITIVALVTTKMFKTI